MILESFQINITNFFLKNFERSMHTDNFLYDWLLTDFELIKVFTNRDRSEIKKHREWLTDYASTRKIKFSKCNLFIKN
jgi:hypothetical protein